ncbi:ribosome maturation factor RimM [Georgenia faecalis]|uniref:Ribosome maturation factor RimM n=1 Tax=Georgenia faecalis TaxID=2483799 RepID=A0ABV9DEA0_9MICO|nr:ribosome maturation factor RimM [Georgenia faecalis]
MERVVARIAGAHGLRGMVKLEVRTDAPAERFVPGAVLLTEPAERGPLTVAEAAERSGSWQVRFAEVEDRTGAEALRGTMLVVETAPGDDDDAWYPQELVGLRVEHVDGRALGTVAAVEHLPAHDVLVVDEPVGARSMIPFVREIVPVVDVAGGRVVVDPPRGLLAADPLDEPDAADEPDDADAPAEEERPAGGSAG